MEVPCEENASMSRKGFEFKRWMVVLAASIYCLTIGFTHCWGNMTVYVSSYLREVGGEDTRYADAQWLYQVMNTVQGLFTFLGGSLEMACGTATSALIAGWICSLGVVLSFFTCQSFWGLIITYGVVFGMGAGLTYTIPISVSLKWHPEHKGLISGIIFVARGLSVFVITPLQTWYVNPNNKSPTHAPFVDTPQEKYFDDMDVLHRVPSLFLWTGVIFAVVQFGTAIAMPSPTGAESEYMGKMIEERQRLEAQQKAQRVAAETREREGERTASGGATGGVEGQEERPSGEGDSLLRAEGGGETGELEEARARREQAAPASPSPIPKLPTGHMVASHQFWSVWAIMYLNWMSISFFNGFWKVIGTTELHVDDQSLARLGMTWAVLSSCSRVVWGVAADWFGFRGTMVVVGVSFWAFLCTVPLCSQWFPHTLHVFLEDLGWGGDLSEHTLGVWAYFVWVNILKIIDGGAFTILPPIVSEMFGATNFPIVFGLLYSARALSSVLSTLLITRLKAAVGLNTMCEIMALGGLSAGLIAFFAPFHQIKLPQRTVAGGSRKEV
uniref:Major facilitator superfamily (MFS) profile domain-containing protein n=1 Tax=Chromera velia CCMP2878 TaxID=1169474 RepID=A0A0G4FUM0_9ALVE|eukprot:Cvel_18867.t1-p1 / transcript=Cvel_18867.t1 / gene=Cvel_18867 / organism=Chromera_velia_CCMP2878 / gene_product=Monocarboxylate transporter 12, putative / transcript_product=Monocarboxylate transporter 12, putative / location=Cvel_scaffold1588:20619-25225(+) / protein_length=555 / sequence_SO=supercontig / SO=protein_coding / is_pseudo=false